MDYFDLLKGSTGPRDSKELTFGDLLSECRESAKEKVDETTESEQVRRYAYGQLKNAGISYVELQRRVQDKFGLDAKDSEGVVNWAKEKLGESKEVSEQDYKEDNEKLNKDETPDMGDRSKDPDSDVPPPPDVVKDNDSPMEMRKEYLGKSEETHYYFITTESGSGDIEDFVIADQDGIKQYSAKEQDMEIVEGGVADFLIAAIRDMDISSIERSIFLKYIYPKLIEEEPEVPLETEEEEFSEEPIEKEEAPEEAKPPRESVVHEGVTGWREATNKAKLRKMGKKVKTKGTAYASAMDNVKEGERVLGLNILGDDELVAKFEELQAKIDSEEADSRIKVKLNTMAEEIKKRGLLIEESKLQELTGGLVRNVTDMLFDRGYEVDFKEVYDYVENLSGEDYDYIQDQLAQGNEEGVMSVLSGLDLRKKNESKESEEFETDQLFELKVTDDKENIFDVYLMDNNEEDTTISINGMEHTFAEYSKYFRDEEGKLTEEGLRELTLDVLANLDEEDYNELVTRAPEEENQEVANSDVAYAHSSQTEGKDTPGVRDGTGPAKGSAQRNISKIGRRKEVGEECSYEDSDESIENIKGNNDMLDEKKTVIALLHAAEKSEQKAKDLRKEADELKKAEKAAEKVAKEKEAKAKAKKESIEPEESKTEITETDVSKGTKALIKLAKEAAKESDYAKAAEHYTKLAEIEAMVPAEAEAEAEKAPEVEEPEEASEESEESEEELEVPEENELDDELGEGKDQPGVRDGTGPAAGSAQRSVSNIGKRKAAGEECPNESEVDEAGIEDSREEKIHYVTMWVSNCGNEDLARLYPLVKKLNPDIDPEKSPARYVETFIENSNDEDLLALYSEVKKLGEPWHTEVDEKKKPPVCKKCGKRHWPFEKCASVKKESKIKVESIGDLNETKQVERLKDLLSM